MEEEGVTGLIDDSRILPHKHTCTCFTEVLDDGNTQRLGSLSEWL